MAQKNKQPKKHYETNYKIYVIWVNDNNDFIRYESILNSMLSL